MAQVKFKRTDNINNVPVDDGIFLVDYENQKAYTDVGENRIQFAGATVLNSQEKTSTEEAYNCNYINDKVAEINDKINDVQYCVATISSAQAISSNYKINLNSINRGNGNFTLSNGGIRIGEGINKIRISASIFVDGWGGGGNYLWGLISKNNTRVAGSIVSGNSSYISSSIATTIIEVEEGDIITLIADAGAGGNLRTGATNTYLCVEKIN